MRRPARGLVALATAAQVLLVLSASGPSLAQAPLCADAPEAGFADRDRIAEVHQPAVDCLWFLGAIQGRVDADGQATFLPGSGVSRGQFAGMVYRLLEASGRAGGLTDVRRPRFDDVPMGHTFDLEVHRLAQAGVIDGVDVSSFAPEARLRRDQAASLVIRAAQVATGQSPEAVGGPYFTDTTGNVHQAAIDVAFEHGIAEGTRAPCEDRGGRFGVAGSLQRQQAASLLVRALERLPAIEAGETGDRRTDAECPSPQWTPNIADAVAYGDQRLGDVSLAVIGTDGTLIGSREDTRVDAASVIKVMFLVAYLRQPDVRDRALTQADRDLLEPMIRQSDNDPATVIANRVGPGPITGLAEAAGMRDFSYTRPWGRSQTSARDQAAFLLEVDRYVPDRHRVYVLQLLTEVVPAQRWGIGQIDTGDWTPHFKGGWGTGTGEVDHQVVLLRHTDGTRVALAVMVTDSPGHDAGKVTLAGVFRRLLADLP